MRPSSSARLECVLPLQIAPFEQLEELERLVNVGPRRARGGDSASTSQEEGEGGNGSAAESVKASSNSSGSAAAKILAHAKVLRESM